MNNFITKTSYQINLSQMQEDLRELLSVHPWPEINFEKKLPGNQLGITHRPNASDIILDSSGSLYDAETKQFRGKESDFTQWNLDTPSYTKQVIENLAAQEGTSFGRIRFMRLMPKTGLSVHRDFNYRYHLAIDTNKYAYFGEHTDSEIYARCYHIPADGYFYKVDTTRDHFVYNGGWEPRIHLVICETE
jgi:hypothetical protein